MRRLVLCALVALTAACGDTPTIPTPPNTNPVTETFTINGASP